MHAFLTSPVFIGATRSLIVTHSPKRAHHRSAYTSTFHTKRSFIMQTTSPSTKSATDSTPSLPDIPTLYDAPISNYGARCRYLIYRKKLHKTTPSTIAISSPVDFAELKAGKYLSFNPLGRIPVLLLPTSPQTTIYESSVICQYLADKYADIHTTLPSFIPSSAEDRARARLIASLLDVYIGPLHPYMYMGNVDGNRAKKISKMAGIFDAIEQLMDDKGPYAVGSELSIADCCLWGNFPFYDFMLPTFFGVDPTEGRPKLKKWREMMASESESAKVVYNEVFSALQDWWDDEHWVEIGMDALTSKPQSTV